MVTSLHWRNEEHVARQFENEILRSKLPARVAVSPQERNRLVKFGCKLGETLGELVTNVHPLRMC